MLGSRSGKGSGKGSGLGGGLLTKTRRDERRERGKEEEKERDKRNKLSRLGTAASPLSHTFGLSHEPEWPIPPLTPNSSMPSPMLSNSSASSSLSSTSSVLGSTPRLACQASNASAPHLLTRTLSLHSHSVTLHTNIKTNTIINKLKSHIPHPKPISYSLHMESREGGKGKEKENPRASFSTLNPTSVAELKNPLAAPESQFVFKGPSYLGSSIGLGLGRNRSAAGKVGVRHHPFEKEEVPYPRSYERGVVDM